MSNVINKEMSEKVAKFWTAYNELVSNEELLRSEIKRCEELYKKIENDSSITLEEEKYIYDMMNLTENLIDSIKCATNYYNI